MKQALRLGAILLIIVALLVTGGCASFMEQARMALEQSGMVTNEAMPGGDDWQAEPEIYDPGADIPAGPHSHIRGRLEGAIYFNDFADIIFAPPEGWVNVQNDDDVYEQEGVDLISTSGDETTSVTILFQPFDPSLDEEAYWAARLEALQEEGFAGQAFEAAFLEPNDYRAATFQTQAGIRRVHLRRLEDHTAIIVLEAPTLAELEELAICFA